MVVFATLFESVRPDSIAKIGIGHGDHLGIIGMGNFGLRTRKQLLRLGRAIHRISPGYSVERFAGEICPACGNSSELTMHGVLWPELVLQWKLTPAWANWIDQREGLRCRNCRSNLRCRHLAKCIVAAMNVRLSMRAGSLSDLCSDPLIEGLKVAEINAAGDLHPILARLPLLCYSEYGSLDPSIPSEDLSNLSYPDESFDLVVTSDVLEHVPDVKRALSQIHRILKIGGVHIFSVPVVWTSKRSRCRAKLHNGVIEHILPPSYHGPSQHEKNDFLVFHEFGQDFVQLCEEVGFGVSLTKDSRNPSVVTFEAVRYK